ncbi:GntR family transcriptional regulator [Aquabacterium sp. A7-Y]|nr:GntR family transcriptional regulator [Aquabacterium sp. A7-Y]MCW7541201.1 GntR family transcriptional regulator [Aquabacterium sp. A7-Y]
MKSSDRALSLASNASLAEQAYAATRQLIFDFELMPGDRFSEAELAERIAVSRTPLRQALQRLQQEGFVQVFPKLGWQVAPLDFDTFDELYDLRVLIECHAVRVLCEAQERPLLAELNSVWLVPVSDRESHADRVRQLDEAFHGQLVRASGNREMMRVHQEITDRIRIVRRLDFTKPARVEATYQEHAKVLRTITQRRADEAQRLLKAHIAQSKREVRDITVDALYRARAGERPAIPS